MKALLAILALAFLQGRSSPPPPVRLFVDTDKSIRVTIPAMDRDEVQSLMKDFFFDGRPNGRQSAAEFDRIVKDSPNLTIVLTTKKE